MVGVDDFLVFVATWAAAQLAVEIIAEITADWVVEEVGPELLGDPGLVAEQVFQSSGCAYDSANMFAALESCQTVLRVVAY